MSDLTPLFPTAAELAVEFPQPVALEQRHYLVAGALQQWPGELAPVVSPVCLRDEQSNTLNPVILGATPLMDSAAALQALDAAVKAYDLGRGHWPTLPVLERIRHIEAFLVAMLKQRDAVIRLLMWEIGKNTADASKEFDRTCDYIRDTVQAMKQQDRADSHFVSEQGVLGKIRRVPLGVVLCMGPFNYPLNETFTTLIPALMMGNTVVFKPAKYGVLLIEPLLQAFADCFPPGVINVIYGRGRETVGALMESGKVDVLAFIGTNKGASDLKRLHPKPHRLKAVLGLDAKNPAIVLPCAALATTATEIIAGALSFNGQRCTALKIIFAPRQQVDALLPLLVAEINKLQLAMPWRAGAQITPMPEPGKTAAMQALIEDALANGATVQNPGGGELAGPLMRPALLYPVSPSMRLYQEEQFGPLVPLVPYDDISEVIEYVIHSNFGQQLSIFGQDGAAIGPLVDLFANQVGRININSQCQRSPDSFPFTGRKDSAEGTLSVQDALHQFSIPTLVAIKGTEQGIGLVRSMVQQRQSGFLATDFLF
ncbi:NADP-dependent glyceraldehyde-3-phosphate dehydrogenase [Rheinheimera sp.]|uniref:NADP-dependent glyceraldehyde-3-phosphate dehydrogenase n=1 Tax=Rheinheimera sp. TaxID=1869214 RepID=UPI00307D3025